MKKLAYLGMFLLAACGSTSNTSNAQAATPAGSCCAEKAEGKGACCSESAPAANAKAAESCCEDKKN